MLEERVFSEERSVILEEKKLGFSNPSGCALKRSMPLVILRRAF